MSHYDLHTLWDAARFSRLRPVTRSPAMSGFAAVALAVGIVLLSPYGRRYGQTQKTSLRGHRALHTGHDPGHLAPASRHGPLPPDGLTSVDRWIKAGFARCFQLMEGNGAYLLQAWTLHRGVRADIEIVPVVPSAQTQDVVRPVPG